MSLLTYLLKEGTFLKRNIETQCGPRRVCVIFSIVISTVCEQLYVVSFLDFYLSVQLFDHQ